jgi:glycosyltransferase-like protein
MPVRERSLRVALFTYATQPRGGVVHVLELGRALHERGHTVVLHALDASGRGLFRPTLCATCIIPVDPMPNATTLAMVRSRIASYIEALAPDGEHFDVYHAHDGISGNALANLTERGVIPGFVRTVHHLDAFADPELAALQTRSIAAARACFVVSDVWRTRLRERLGRDAVVVPSGVDAVRLARPADDVRRALRCSFGFGDEPVFATIGGIESRKNTIAILEAFARVRVDLPQAALVIAGGASVLDHESYRAAFDARVAELGLGAAIRLLGVLDDDGIARVLHAADTFVFPSLVEGFGLVVLEALAAGLPVVTSAIAPFTEYLGGADAYFAQPDDVASIADAMLRASGADARERARRAGPALAERFTWDASARAHLPVYRAAARAAGEVSVA